MKKIFVPLFWKFTMALVLIVATFGSLNMWMIYHEVNNSFQEELDTRGIFIANTFAERALKPISYDDYSELYHLTLEIKNVDPGVEYAFLLDEYANVISHTFHTGVPEELILLHKRNPPNKTSIKLVVPSDSEKSLIRDYSVPILDGKAGTIRIGLKEQAFYSTINKVLTRFLLMVLAFLIVGILGAFIFSYIITKPIKGITRRAINLNLDSLDSSENIAGSLVADSWWSKPFPFVKDELDMLTIQFEEMIRRLRAAHMELKNTQNSLIQSEKMGAVGTLVAGIAHEINNPIAGLRNCIARISKNPENLEQTEKYLPIMAEATQKVEFVVKGLLNFSKKHDYEFTHFEVAPVLDNVLLLTAYLLEKSRISFSKDLPNRHFEVYGSPRHIEQVIMNLVINSIDAIKERKSREEELNGQLEFAVYDNPSYAVFVISDNGCGVEEDKLSQIFDPYYTTKSVGNGTGLGLSISYNIISEHRGVIEARLNGKGGLDVKFTLPWKEEKGNS